MSEANNHAENTTEVKFRDDLLELEEKFKPHLVADPTTGVMTIPEGVVFENAPEGVTAEGYEKSKKYLDLAANALTKLGSGKAVELFKENKDLQEATLSVPIFKKDSYEGVFKRRGQSRNVRTGEVSNYVGAIGVGRINVVSTRTQTEWTAIKTNMRNLADAAGLE